jgi:hypothetical protein
MRSLQSSFEKGALLDDRARIVFDVEANCTRAGSGRKLIIMNMNSFGNPDIGFILTRKFLLEARRGLVSVEWSKGMQRCWERGQPYATIRGGGLDFIETLFP